MSAETLPLVEGLTAWTGKPGDVSKGRFPLPVGFDSNKFVGKWVKNGPSIKTAEQPQSIPSEGVVAQGWTVWKDKNKRPCMRTVSSGVFVLMIRPKVLQEAVNKIYGNASRRRMIQEAEGNTLSVQEMGGTTSGMLTSKTLEKIPGLSSGTSEPSLEGQVSFNDLNPSQAESPVEAVVHKPSRKFLEK